MAHYLFISKRLRWVLFLWSVGLSTIGVLIAQNFIIPDLTYQLLNANLLSLVVYAIFLTTLFTVSNFVFFVVLKRPTAIVTDFGITLRSTPFWPEAFIAWSNIKALEHNEIFGTEKLLITLKDQSKCFANRSLLRRSLSFVYRGLTLGLLPNPFSQKSFYVSQSLIDVPLKAVEQTIRQELKLVQDDPGSAIGMIYEKQPRYPAPSIKTYGVIGTVAALPLFCFSLFNVYLMVNPIVSHQAQMAQVLQQAAEHGDANAINQIGWRYQHGIGLPQSNREAFKWYKRAAELNFAKGQFNLAMAYRHGYGTRQSHRKSAALLQKASYKDFKPAERELGYAYLNGLGVRQSYEKAFKLLHTAAAAGDGLANYYLGSMYETGQGADVSFQSAMAFYKKAADNGVEPAKHALQRLNDKPGEQQVWLGKW